MICDRDCFNCQFEDCRLPLNDIDGDEKRFSRTLDEMAIYENSDNTIQKKIRREKQLKTSRREYMRAYMKDRYHGTNDRKYRKKVLRIGDDVTQFESVAAAAKSVHGNPSPISECCRGKRNRYYGYQWRYAE